HGTAFGVDRDRDSILAHGDVVYGDDLTRPTGDVETLQRGGPVNAAARAQSDVDLGVGRVRIVDHEPLLHPAGRGSRGEVPVRGRLGRARGGVERLGPLDPLFDEYTSTEGLDRERAGSAELISWLRKDRIGCDL